jgi:hypothetical protein
MYAKPQHRSAQRIGWREHTRSGQERPIGIRRQKDRRVPITPTPRPRASATPQHWGALRDVLQHGGDPLADADAHRRQAVAAPAAP